MIPATTRLSDTVLAKQDRLDIEIFSCHNISLTMLKILLPLQLFFEWIFLASAIVASKHARECTVPCPVTVAR